jgi:predicted RNA binding protein YcfA (HicA-like mRNA interferase family)/predicted RNase H-like HicB family nuclease
MARKIRALLQDLNGAGFYQILGGKGSHRKLVHPRYRGAVTLSGKLGDDAKTVSGEAGPPSDQGGSRMKKSDQYHKWVEWSEEDGVYIGKCPDLITGIHGDDPKKVYADLCQVIEDVIAHFESEGRSLPPPRVRPMQEVQ